MTIHSKAVEQFFTVVLFVFQFYPVCNFGKNDQFWTLHCEEWNRWFEGSLYCIYGYGKFATDLINLRVEGIHTRMCTQQSMTWQLQTETTFFILFIWCSSTCDLPARNFSRICSYFLVEFYEDILSIVCTCTCFEISQSMWTVFYMIFEAFQRDAFDYFAGIQHMGSGI